MVRSARPSTAQSLLRIVGGVLTVVAFLYLSPRMVYSLGARWEEGERMGVWDLVINGLVPAGAIGALTLAWWKPRAAIAAALILAPFLLVETPVMYGPPPPLDAILVAVAAACHLAGAIRHGGGRPRENLSNRKADREQLRAEYGPLFDEVAAILFEVDPMGINYQENADEYEFEAGLILPRLRTCESSTDVRWVIHEEFSRWFGSAAPSPESKYETAAERIWAAWQRARS